ncbi:hypothetical protein WJX74_010544 [Apatococcus lobatus]|uniref:Uncharacterized protein n=1 Tax=Apatococcus lobatus TaxID=904363 RepID=A0AAW1S6L1_9CHLO
MRQRAWKMKQGRAGHKRDEAHALRPQVSGAKISDAGAAAESSCPPVTSGQVLLNLKKRATTLGKEVQPGCFLLHYATPSDTARQLFFVDSDGHMRRQIEGWLSHSANHTSGSSSELRPARWPLIVSGVIKAGKTTCLEVLLPALTAADPVFGVGRPKEVIIIDIRMPNKRTGRAGLLAALLSKLMIRWRQCQLQAGGCSALGVLSSRSAGRQRVPA